MQAVTARVAAHLGSDCRLVKRLQNCKTWTEFHNQLQCLRYKKDYTLIDGDTHFDEQLVQLIAKTAQLSDIDSKLRNAILKVAEQELKRIDKYRGNVVDALHCKSWERYREMQEICSREYGQYYDDNGDLIDHPLDEH